MKKSIHRIEELGKVVGGGTPKTEVSEFWGGEIPWLSPSDLTGYKKVFIERGSKNITELGLKKSSTVMLPKNTVLLSSRAPIGYIALARNSICTNQGFKSIICNEKAFPLYLYYYLKENVETLKNFASGATFPELSASRLKHIKIEICDDIETQKKIACFLYKYDELIENNNERIQILEKISEEIYKEWFIRFRFPGYQKYKIENGVPQGWKIENIGNRFRTVLGGTPSRIKNEYWEGGTIPRINSGEINKNQINKASEYITELGYKRTSTELLPIKSTLIAITGATLGQVSINEIEVCTNQSVVGIYDENGIYAYYLFHTIRTYIDDIGNRASGGAQQHINKDIINKYKIIIPDIETVKRFFKIIDPIFEEIKNLNKKNDTLIEQRDLLLPRLMSGKLEVK